MLALFLRPGMAKNSPHSLAEQPKLAGGADSPSASCSTAAPRANTSQPGQGVMAWLASAGHAPGTGMGLRGGEDPQTALLAVSSWEGNPSWGGHRHTWLRSWPQTPRAFPAAHQEAWQLPKSTALISQLLPTPPTPHWYTYTFAVYRYTQRAVVRMGATKPTRQPAAPRALRRWGTQPHSALGLGAGRGCGPPGADITFKKPWRVSVGEQEPPLT